MTLKILYNIDDSSQKKYKPDFEIVVNVYLIQDSTPVPNVEIQYIFQGSPYTFQNIKNIKINNIVEYIAVFQTSIPSLADEFQLKSIQIDNIEFIYSFDIIFQRGTEQIEFLTPFADNGITFFNNDIKVQNPFTNVSLTPNCFNTFQNNELTQVLRNMSYLYPVLNTSYGIIRIALPFSYDPETQYSCEFKSEADLFQVYFYGIFYIMASENKTLYSNELEKIKFLIDHQYYVYMIFGPDVISTDIKKWGQKTVYTISNSFSFWYSGQNPEWPGNIQNVPPNIPITNELYDPKTNINWCPQIYGQNFNSLQECLSSDHIGPVDNFTETSWPT